MDISGLATGNKMFSGLMDSCFIEWAGVSPLEMNLK